NIHSLDLCPAPHGAPIRIFGISLSVRDVYRSPLKGSACRGALASRGDWVPFYELSELRRCVVERCEPQELPVEPIDERSVGIAQPRRRPDKGTRHRLQVKSRAADDLQHVGGGGLLLQGFPQLVKQAGVLDGDDSLLREILD